ncbi:hypothetical protein CCACVL1_00986 [Corchorus capsularis]|uniref:Uncharacterized protein n=1 Tax=Corchorus capsularis TaxID=210143 RepID=A0A1R3K1J9_COCAP|nr:hypothetical protein CCACVL1_03276 [Corchorus capsularis]OMP10348.1 hypothetical protein CCACVL1_00986 [Corchorus capsularis]
MAGSQVRISGIPASKDLFQCVRFRRDGVSDSTPY